MCVVDSLYSLFLYYLICGVNPDDMFIFSGGVAKSVRKNINHIYFLLFRHDDIPNSNIIFKLLKRATIIFKHAYGIIRLRIILFFKTRNYDIEVYGQANLNFSFPLYEYEKSYLIEDGVLNYTDLGIPDYNNKRKFDKLLKFMGFHVANYNECFGTHKNIKKIYLTQKNVPEVIKDKTEVIDIKKMWKDKTDEEKNKILEIYNLKDTINKIEDNSILLLTECFSEDGTLPFDEEISIYEELIEKQENKNIIIKTHPRETKNYKDIFPELVVINQPFPLEILKCMDINIKKVITIASSATLNFADECEIELYEKETSSKEINNAKSTLKKQLLHKSDEKFK